jgi:hypothetical protein
MARRTDHSFNHTARTRARNSDARHLDRLRRSAGRFEDIDPALLAAEQAADTGRLLLPEIRIASTAQLCVESALAEPDIDEHAEVAGGSIIPPLWRRRIPMRAASA